MWKVELMKTKSLLIPATLGIALIAGCATNDPAQRTKTGAAIGAVAGAVLGHQVDGDKGRFVGAVAGALAGGAVGQYMDEQQRQLEADLEAERAASEIEISRLADDTLRLDVSSEVSFAVDSAQITPTFFGSLDKIAAVVADYPQTAVHIVGHTDSSGSDNYNYKLSLRRASSCLLYTSPSPRDS